MIQLIALRPYIDSKTGKDKKKHELLGTATSHKDLFGNLEQHLARFLKEDLWNIYYTALHCLEPAKHGGALRLFDYQEDVPFDFDGIDCTQLGRYQKLFFEVTCLDPNKTVIVASGNGLQFLVQTDRFTDITFFEQKKLQYKTICDRLNEAMAKEGLPGGADVSVWSPARILRMPGTENRKPKQGVKQATLLQGNLERQVFDWDKISGIPELTVAEHLAEWNDKKAPKLDNRAIVTGCDYMKWMQVHPEQIREPLFYAGLSIFGRMENGRALAHKIQEAIRNSGSDSSVATFSPQEVDDKLDQALANSGPRTCININSLWGNCSKCPNFNKITSPVQLKSPDFIATLETGFYRATKKGMVPAQDDLLKFFDQKTRYKTLNQNGLVYGWNGTHYINYTDVMIKNFAAENFKPFPKASYLNEFFNMVSANNLVSQEFFATNEGFINFKNGVLNIEKETLIPHDPKFGFRYVLPYGYDPSAVAFRFEKFLDEVTCNDGKLRAILEEFGGWALSGDPYWIHKCLLLSGEGKNGKSKYQNALRFVAGEENVSCMTLRALDENQNNRQLLEGKLINIASEMGDRDMRNTDTFKRLTDGAPIDIKMMYYQPYTKIFNTKLIFACNTLPLSTDQSYGFLRRMLIVPFNATFEGDAEDQFLDDKFKAELPGIFNVFLRGYKRLRAQKEFTKSEKTTLALREYSDECNPVSNFLFENPHITVNPFDGKGTFVTLDDLFAHFADWNSVGEARDKKVGQLNLVTFSKNLRRALPNGQDRVARISGLGSEKVRVVWDIELKVHDADKTYLKKEGQKPILRGAQGLDL